MFDIAIIYIYLFLYKYDIRKEDNFMYALFSQQKLVYQGLLGAAQTELMNITHQHEDLALRDTGLKSKLSSIQEYYANQKSDLYDQLTYSMSESDYKTLIDGNSNFTGHVKSETDNGDGTTTKQFYTKFEWLAKTYGLTLTEGQTVVTEQQLTERGICLRTDIENELEKLDNKLSTEEAKINKQIDETARKETRLDTEKASIETKITDYQKQLEKIEEAEGKGIEASIGKFQGVG